MAGALAENTRRSGPVTQIRGSVRIGIKGWDARAGGEPFRALHREKPTTYWFRMYPTAEVLEGRLAHFASAGNKLCRRFDGPFVHVTPSPDRAPDESLSIGTDEQFVRTLNVSDWNYRTAVCTHRQRES